MFKHRIGEGQTGVIEGDRVSMSRTSERSIDEFIVKPSRLHLGWKTWLTEKTSRVNINFDNIKAYRSFAISLWHVNHSTEFDPVLQWMPESLRKFRRVAKINIVTLAWHLHINQIPTNSQSDLRGLDLLDRCRHPLALARKESDRISHFYCGWRRKPVCLFERRVTLTENHHNSRCVNLSYHGGKHQKNRRNHVTFITHLTVFVTQSWVNSTGRRFNPRPSTSRSLRCSWCP